MKENPLGKVVRSPLSPSNVSSAISLPIVSETVSEVSYQANDLYLAAAMVMKDLKPEYVVSGRRVTFVWRQQDAAETANQYYSGELSVDALGLADTIRRLKTVVHNLSGSAVW